MSKDPHQIGPKAVTIQHLDELPVGSDNSYEEIQKFFDLYKICWSPALLTSL